MAKQRTNLYRISVVDDETHNELWVRRFTKLLLWASVAAVAIIGAAVVYCLIAFTPVRTSIPGYPDANTRNAAVQNVIKIDSLERIITRWEFYAENLRRVVEGRAPLDIDSVMKSSDAGNAAEADPAALAGRDSLLRTKVLEAGQFSISNNQRTLDIEGLHFFAPLKGVVSKGFDPVLHPYIDITAPAGSLVMTALDGTVVFTGWNDELGYTIAVQHSGDILTIYKHNQKLLKKDGDKVKAGTPIALVGDTGAESSGDHLHFELWHDGGPLDPTQYISF